MLKVIKRNQKLSDFNLERIRISIEKAFQAAGKLYTDEIINLLALRITADFQVKAKEGAVHIEDIQDSMERVLEQTGYKDAAKAYICYRRNREKIRNMKATSLDYRNIVNHYLKIKDWSVKENSTVTYSVGGLILNNSGIITSNYWLSEIYDEETSDAHRKGDLHINDLSMLTGYSAGWSLKQLIKEGLGGIPGRIALAPARHLSVLCSQMVNFLGMMQKEWSGAQAFSSFDTYLAPFVKAEHLSYREVKRCMESFVYGVNTLSCWGTQAPCTNITLDWMVPDDLAEVLAVVGGKEMDFRYKDCKKEMDIINKAFLEVMLEGDAEGNGFAYPIPTYAVTKDFDWSETENNRLLFEMTAKYGTPHFLNHISSDRELSDVRSRCCGQRLNLRELRKKSGGYFGAAGECTGSVGVVTVNMPKIAYLAKDKKDFYRRLDYIMDLSARSLNRKRTVISKLLEEGLYPYTKRYLKTFNNHFSTIGVIGMNEAGLNAKWIGKDMSSKQTQEFTKEVLEHMRERLGDYQETYGEWYNLEATTAESVAYCLAKYDNERYPGIITAGKEGERPYYTNSSLLPVDYDEDIFHALEIQDELQTLYTSEMVFHVYLKEKLPDWKTAADLVRKIAENYRLQYYTISPADSVCTEQGYLAGGQFTCTVCGETEVLDVESSVQEPNTAEYGMEIKKYLFITNTCPNCVLAEELLRGEDVTVIDAKEHMDLVTEYGVTQAPTLVIKEGGEVKKYVNASNIKSYVENC